MLGVYKGGDTPRLLGFSNCMKRDCCLSRTLRAENLDYAPSWKAPNAKRHVKRQDSGRDDFDRGFEGISQPHYRTVAELASYVVDGKLKYVVAGLRRFFLRQL